MKYASWLITVTAIVQILGFLYALPEHLDESTWSAHAQFHHVLGFLWLAGLNITIMRLVWRPLQQREKRGFWMLLVACMFGQGGYFVALLLVPAGRPMETWHHLALGLNWLLNVIGLGLAWRALSKPVAA